MNVYKVNENDVTHAPKSCERSNNILIIIELKYVTHYAYIAHIRT